jgi:hypothetical protein
MRFDASGRVAVEIGAVDPGALDAALGGLGATMTGVDESTRLLDAYVPVLRIDVSLNSTTPAVTVKVTPRSSPSPRRSPGRRGSPCSSSGWPPWASLTSRGERGAVGGRSTPDTPDQAPASPVAQRTTPAGGGQLSHRPAVDGAPLPRLLTGWRSGSGWRTTVPTARPCGRRRTGGDRLPVRRRRAPARPSLVGRAQSRKATLRMALDWPSVFIRTRCQPISVIVRWSAWRMRPRT